MPTTTYDTAQINVGAGAQVRVAPVGTTVPATFTAPTWDAAFVELGYTDDKGVTVNDQKTIYDVKAHQSLLAILKVVTERKQDLGITLLQWNKNTFALAFGGGTWTTTTGVASYTPPANTLIDARLIVLDWQSQGHNYRWALYKAIVDGNVQTTISKGAEAPLPLTLGLVGGGTGAPWGFWTDDPAFQ